MNKHILPLILFGLNSTLAWSEISPVLSGSAIEASKLNQVIQAVNNNDPIGTVKTSILTLSQFQNILGNCWKLMDGSSLAGTDLGLLTGAVQLPNMENGEFLRQATASNPVGSIQSDAIRNITGSFTTGRTHYNTNPVSSGSFVGVATAGASWDSQKSYGYYTYSFDASRQVPVANEIRPKNLSVNFFIKVNKQCN